MVTCHKPAQVAHRDVLHEQIASELASVGVSEPARAILRNHPQYTPRTLLWFTSLLKIIGPIENIDAIARAAAAATTEADTLAYVNYVRMLAWYQLNHRSLQQVITSTRFPTVLTTENVAILALPLDHLAWTQTAGSAATGMSKFQEKAGFERLVVLLAGQPSDMARTALGERGIELLPRYSF